MVIYKKELILNVTVFVVRVWRIAIYRGNDTEFFLFVSGRRETGFCEVLAKINMAILWSVAVNCFSEVAFLCRKVTLRMIYFI